MNEGGESFLGGRIAAGIQAELFHSDPQIGEALACPFDFSWRAVHRGSAGAAQEGAAGSEQDQESSGQLEPVVTEKSEEKRGRWATPGGKRGSGGMCGRFSPVGRHQGGSAAVGAGVLEELGKEAATIWTAENRHGEKQIDDF